MIVLSALVLDTLGLLSRHPNLKTPTLLPWITPRSLIPRTCSMHMQRSFCRLVVTSSLPLCASKAQHHLQPIDSRLARDVSDCETLGPLPIQASSVPYLLFCCCPFSPPARHAMPCHAMCFEPHIRVLVSALCIGRHLRWIVADALADLISQGCKLVTPSS